MERTALFGLAAILSCAFCLDLPPPHPVSIPPEVYTCDDKISVWFNGTGIDCGTPLPLESTQIQPKIIYKDAAPGMLYTVIIVDRDALSMSSSEYSPVIHFIVSNVTATILKNGLDSQNVLTLNPFFAFSPPAPFPGTGCHRYYVILYQQAAGVYPTMEFIPPDAITQRLNWNFPQWATNYSLSEIAVNYFLTQNPVNNTGTCEPPPPACPPPPQEVCCTRVLSSTSTSVSVSLPFRAVLSSLTLWVDYPSGSTPPPAGMAPANPLAGLGISIGSSDIMTGCAISAPMAAAGTWMLPGYQSAMVTCGSAGPQIGISVPSALRPGAAPGPVAVKVCVVNATMAMDMPDAVLSFKF